ncbi:MAG: hypothetical protein HOP15_04645 [Planctomycetes bacterium]|nr:hypothetical protein [Planctomycetota bacterium]
MGDDHALAEQIHRKNGPTGEFDHEGTVPIHEERVRFTQGRPRTRGIVREAFEGYWELGYGYTFGRGAAKDADYNNLTAAFTRRYGGCVRALFNFGQDSSPETARGGLLLVENSLITSDPYGCVPYFNLFAGHDHPQSLARAAGAGGVLKNNGINFEADALTAFPALDASGHDSYGAALGLELLMGFDASDPALRSQLVFELAGQHPYGDDAAAAGDEAGPRPPLPEAAQPSLHLPGRCNRRCTRGSRRVRRPAPRVSLEVLRETSRFGGRGARFNMSALTPPDGPTPPPCYPPPLTHHPRR